MNNIASIRESTFKTKIEEITKTIVDGILKGLQTKIDGLTNQNNEIKKKRKKWVNTLDAKVVKLETTVEYSVIYSRRNCLRVSGVPENIYESTDDYVCNLSHNTGVVLTYQDNDRSH